MSREQKFTESAWHCFRVIIQSWQFICNNIYFEALFSFVNLFLLLHAVYEYLVMISQIRLRMVTGFPLNVLVRVFGGNRTMVAVVPVSFLAAFFALIVPLRCKEFSLQIPIR